MCCSPTHRHLALIAAAASIWRAAFMAANRRDGKRAGELGQRARAAVDQWMECREAFLDALASELGWKPESCRDPGSVTARLRQAAAKPVSQHSQPSWSGAHSAAVAWLNANEYLGTWVTDCRMDCTPVDTFAGALAAAIATCRGYPYRVLDLASKVARVANALRMVAVEGTATEKAMAQDAADPVASALADRLGVTEGRVVAALFEAGVLGAAELDRAARRRGATRVREALARLRRAGIVEHPIDAKGEARHGQWRLTDLGRKVYAACIYTT